MDTSPEQVEGPMESISPYSEDRDEGQNAQDHGHSMVDSTEEVPFSKGSDDVEASHNIIRSVERSLSPDDSPPDTQPPSDDDEDINDEDLVVALRGAASSRQSSKVCDDDLEDADMFDADSNHDMEVDARPPDDHRFDSVQHSASPTKYISVNHEDEQEVEDEQCQEGGDKEAEEGGECSESSEQQESPVMPSHNLGIQDLVTEGTIGPAQALVAFPDSMPDENMEVACGGVDDLSIDQPMASVFGPVEDRQTTLPHSTTDAISTDIPDFMDYESNKILSFPDLNTLSGIADQDPDSLFVPLDPPVSASSRNADQVNMDLSETALPPKRPNLARQRIKKAQEKARDLVINNQGSGAQTASRFKGRERHKTSDVSHSLAEEAQYNKEQKALVKQRDELQKRLEKEGEDFELGIELQKVKRQITDLEQRRKMHEAYMRNPQSDDESSTYQGWQPMSQGRKRSSAAHYYDDMSDDKEPLDSDEDQTVSSRLKSPSKPRKSKAAKEDLEQSAKFEYKGRPKKKAKTETSTETSKGKGKSKEDDPSKVQVAKNASKKSADRDKDKTKKSNKQKSMLDYGKSMFESLTSANLIKDAAGNNGAGAAPTFNAKTRKDAFSQLIAAVDVDTCPTAEMDKAFLARATKEFTGHSHACKADGKGGWLIRGMKSSLTNFQVLGSSFMRKRETGTDEPRGGILADQMGLGKTVQTLAVIANGSFVREENGPRTTLIVAPASLCTQWYDEIHRHCEPRAHGKILKLYGGHRPDSNDIVGLMRSFDIIITTFHEVLRSYPFADPPLNCQTAEDKAHWWKIWYEKEKGPFHRIQFLRIVLDEAQAIKSFTSKTSIACRSLRGVHKWALSATPIMNKAVELYPYFKFLRVPHTGTYEIFKENYSGEPANIRRLHAQLNRFMCRRTHKDKMFGKPILQIPAASEQVVWLSFNQIEKRIYHIVSNRIQERINDFSKKGTLNQNYSSMLTWLLRLRQLTCHVLLLETVCRDLLEPEDYHQLSDLAKEEAHSKVQEDKSKLLIALRRVLAAQAANGSKPKNDAPTPTNEVEAILADIDLDTVGKSHGLAYEFKEYIEALKNGENWAEINSRIVCAYCNSPPHEPWVAECFHAHCKECIQQVQQVAAINGIGDARCVACSLPFRGLKALAESYNNASSNAETTDGGKKKGKGKRKKKKDAESQAEAEEEETALKSWINIDGAMLPSPKTVAVKAQLLNWFAENANTKVIIYTQFIPMIHILGKICHLEDWKFVKYYGGMTMSNRDKAIADFGDVNQGIQVFIASLKCGGLGLNLTMASKVICIDPWWNDAVDQQAFGRVFRIGQQNKTNFTRLFISHSVDDHMYAMQERKKQEIDQVIERPGDRKRLTVKELVSLFKPRTDDENDDGTGFILVEDAEDEAPNPHKDAETMSDSL